MQFNILQHDSNMKNLSKFYKILTELWLNEAFIDNFETYLSHLNSVMRQVFSLDEDAVRQTPSVRVDLLKLFHIMTGILTGLNTNKQFGMFFEWFYPDYFQIIHKTLQCLLNDDEVVLLIFKFLQELVYNRAHRLRFDTWSINGLIVFRETAKILQQYFLYTDCLQKKEVKNNRPY